MPVLTGNRESGKLDRIIQIADAVIGSDLDPDRPGDTEAEAFSVRRALGTEAADLSALILSWNAIPADTTGQRWFLYQGVEATVLGGTAYYGALDGTFPLEAAVAIAGVPVDIASMEVPVVSGGSRMTYLGLSPVADRPTIDADGDAVFANSRAGVGYGLAHYELILGLGRTAYGGVIVNIDAPGVPVASYNAQTPAVAHIGLTEAGGINLVLENIRAVWAQLTDQVTVALDQADGIEAAETIFEETRQYLLRTKIPAETVIVDDGDLRFGVQSVEPIDRGRYYRVTASRKYVGVAL